ncbi:hypothetical protein AAC387_Pa08g1234 [Persea americana]
MFYKERAANTEYEYKQKKRWLLNLVSSPNGHGGSLEVSRDDQIILNGIIFYMVNMLMDATKNLPLWTTDGAVLMALFHMGPVEFLYYWLHRGLHHHFLYSRYHSHHHSSIATEPITSVIHPFAEILLYYLLFAIPFLAMTYTRTASILAAAGYLTYIDFMNNLGHCNFELVPRWLFTIFPFLKYFMYTPTSDLLTPVIQTEKPHFFYVTGQQTDVDEIGISSPQQNLDPLQHLATGFFDGDGPGSSTFSDEISIRTALCKDRTQTELDSYSNQKRMAESGVLSVSLRHFKPDRKPLSPFFLQTQLDFRPPTPNPIAAPITCSTTPNPRKNPILEEIGGQSH